MNEPKPFQLVALNNQIGLVIDVGSRYDRDCAMQGKVELLIDIFSEKLVQESTWTEYSFIKEPNSTQIRRFKDDHSLLWSAYFMLKSRSHSDLFACPCTIYRWIWKFVLPLWRTIHAGTTERCRRRYRTEIHECLPPLYNTANPVALGKKLDALVHDLNNQEDSI